jgi:hypothetical protein
MSVELQTDPVRRIDIAMMEAATTKVPYLIIGHTPHKFLKSWLGTTEVLPHARSRFCFVTQVLHVDCCISSCSQQPESSVQGRARQRLHLPNYSASRN